MIRTAITLLTLSLLAGCGGGASNQPAPAPRTLDATQNQIIAMPEGTRNGVLIRAIRDANQPCNHVERSEDRGVIEGIPVYVATCQGGATYTVTIGSGGNAGVTPGTPR